MLKLFKLEDIKRHIKFVEHFYKVVNTFNTRNEAEPRKAAILISLFFKRHVISIA